MFFLFRGRNSNGQLGTGDSDDRLDGKNSDLVAVDLGTSSVTAIAAGGEHTCALIDDGSVKVCESENVYLV